MTVKSRLAAVLRARRVQEDISRGDVARANAEREQARALAAERAEVLNTWSGLRSGDSTAYLASVAAGRALASSLHAAVALERSTAGEVEQTNDRLRGAARRRRSVEKLVERATETARTDALAAEQRVSDDLTSGRTPGGRP